MQIVEVFVYVFASATTNPGNRREFLVCTPEPWEYSNVSQISHGHRRPSSHFLLFFHLFFIFLPKKIVLSFFRSLHFFISMFFHLRLFILHFFTCHFFIFHLSCVFSFFLLFIFSSFSFISFFIFFPSAIPFCLYVLLVETSFESFASQLLALTFVPPSIPYHLSTSLLDVFRCYINPVRLLPGRNGKENHFPMFSQTHRALGSLLLLFFLASLPSFFSISFEKKLVANS